MNSVCCLAVALVAALPGVELSTLDGKAHTGQLQRLTGTSVVLATAGDKLEVPVADVLEIRLDNREDRTPPAEPLLAVSLSDGSHVACTEVVAEGNRAVLQSPRLGRVTIPYTALANVRFVGFDANVEGAWRELCQREHKQDLVVVRKENVLDHYEGIVGAIEPQTVKFLLDGEEIPVKRAKAFGLILARPKQETGDTLCRISLLGGDLIHVRELMGDADGLQAELLTGVRVSVPLEAVAKIDFSGGKVLYLSQVEPRVVKYTPFFDHVWEYRRDRNLDGGPLRVGGKTYARGLAIHSRTLLSYRLGGDYRRFQAVMGIDQTVELAEHGREVRVVISGDGNTLLETNVSGADDAQEIDLDVSNVRDLEILVDFGRDQLDIADHLDLADAKVIK